MARSHVYVRSKYGPWIDKHGRPVCACTGYHFPHRKCGGACEHSKTRDIHMARRHGDEEALLQAFVDFIWDHPGKAYAGPCPF